MSGTGSKKLRAILLASLMVLWVLAGTVAFAGGAAAGNLSDTSITVANTSPGATTAMTAAAGVDADQDSTSLQKVRIDTDSSTDFSNVGDEDVTIYVNGEEAGGTGASVSNDGSQLTVNGDTSLSLAEGDRVKLEVSGNVQLPSTAGTYEYDYVINPQNDPKSTGTDTVTTGDVFNEDTGKVYGSLQEAVSNVGSEETLVVRSDYTPNQELLIDEQGVTIKGEDGQNRPTVRADNLGTGDELFKVRGSGVTIKDLVIRDDTSSGVTWNIRTTADGLTVNNVVVERRNSDASGYGNPAVVIKNADHATIKNSDFTNGAIGASIPSDGSLTIQSNSFDMPSNLPNPIWVTGIDFAELSGNEDLAIENNGGLAYATKTEAGYFRGYSSITAAFESPSADDPIASGATLELGDGTYEESVTVSKDVTITNGTGASPVIDGGSSNALDIQSDVTVENVNLTSSGLVIDASNAENLALSNVRVEADGHRGLYAKAPVTISKSHFENIRTHENTHYGIRLEGNADGSSITGTTFEKFRHGVILASVSDTTIDGSTFRENYQIFDLDGDGNVDDEYGTGVKVVAKANDVTGTEITNSEFTNNARGVAFLERHDTEGKTSITGSTLTNNDFTGSIYYGAVAHRQTSESTRDYSEGGMYDAGTITEPIDATDNYWDSSAGPSASANTYNVGSQGDAVTDGVTITPWLDAPTDDSPSSFAPVTTDSGAQEASVQAGVDSAETGGTVSLKPGTFTEAVEVNEDVTLTRDESVDWSGTLDPTIRFAPESVDGTPTVNIVADGVEVESVIVERALNNRDQDSPYAQGIAVRASDTRVHNTIVSADAGSGSVDNTVGIAVLDNDPVSNVTISGEVFGDNFASGVSEFQTGVMVSEYFSNSIDDVDIEGISVSLNRDGIVVKSHHSESAVTDVSVTGSEVTNNDRNGVAVFSEGTFQGDDLAVQSADTVTVDQTDIVGNADSGVLNENPDSTLDATNNYWGTENGPSGEGSGDGDAVSQNVDYDPFLEQTNFPGSGDVSLTADPDEADDGSSTHTLTYTVSISSSLAGADLEDVQLDYSNVANDGGGSTSSVSDPSNAEVRILDSNGDVRTAIETPTSVEVSSNVVTVDVSGASGDLTLQQGDQIEVTIDPVSNPSEGPYTVPVTVDSTGAATDQADATLEITQSSDDGSSDDGGTSPGGSPSPGGSAPSNDDSDDSDDGTDDDTEEDTVPAANVSATETVEIVDEDPDSPGITVSTGNNTSVRSITFSNESTRGNVTVNDVDAAPDEAGSPPGRTVRTVEINVPEQARNESATFEVSVDREDLDGAPEDELTVTRYNDSAGEWQTLNTSVVESDNSSVVLEAETPGFSFFSVTAPDEESTPTPTETVTETETETETETTAATETDVTTESEGDGPGFGPLLAILALLGAALIATRKQ
jgi:PGF-pre-PGF domain-containing protein/surface glycoprotein (TIGR04207 family)/PGF-CTERM protein